MSAPVCGFCGAPTLNGSLCKGRPGREVGCWDRLQELLRRLVGIDGDLATAVAKAGRYGETVSASSAPGVPINLDAADMRRALGDRLNESLRVAVASFPRFTVSGAAVMILGHPRAVLRSWVGPALLGDLVHLVPRAVEMTDKPRNRPGVRIRCPHCAQLAWLQAVMGSLRCSACREVSTIAEVRRAG